MLSSSEDGGVLAIHRVDGSLIRRTSVMGKGAPPPQPVPVLASPLTPARDAVIQIHGEGKAVDKGFEWGADFAVIAFGSATSAFIAPPVLEAARSGWIAVALATFTWTVGWCAIWFLAFSGRANGAGLFMGAGPLVFFLSASIATLINRGELALARDGSISLAGIVDNAMDAYGPLGAVLGLGIGMWIGSRLARYFPARAA